MFDDRWLTDTFVHMVNIQREWNELEDETPFRYAHAEIRTQVEVICGPTRYQPDNWVIPPLIRSSNPHIITDVWIFRSMSSGGLADNHPARVANRHRFDPSKR